MCVAALPAAPPPRAPLALLLAYTVAFALLALWALSAPSSAICSPLLSPLFPPPPLPAAGGHAGKAEGARGSQEAEGAQAAEVHGGLEGESRDAERLEGVERDGDDSSEAARGAGEMAAEAQAAPPRFMLYRLIGNNMAPLQCAGQLLRNTLYALQHEARALRECRRVWVLNHIVNGTEQALLVDALLAHGVLQQDILIRRINYSHIATLPESSWTDAVTAQNEARNFILEHGRAAGARWILAFDGNQFITAEAWDLIRRAAARHEAADLKLFKVPMYRVHQEQSPRWLASRTRFQGVQRFAPQMWESQVAFRNDSHHRYTEGMAYGKDNKLELIDRVCGTGRFEQEERQRRRQQAEQRRRKKQEELRRQRESQQQGPAQHEQAQQGAAPEGRRLLQVECGAGSGSNSRGRDCAEGGRAEMTHSGGRRVMAGEQGVEQGGVGGRRAQQQQQQQQQGEALPADTGQCGCHREVGRDHRIKDADPAIAGRCGYTMRLWYFPCPGVDGARIFVDKRYRAALRDKGYQLLSQQIRDAVRHAVRTGEVSQG
ncbi:hypothetical protein CLOM_g15731 [Closterium sp. NIES-68]|nr:hypothetical protein CLOM_g15731 [Closterium sp. NIES-68]